MPPLRKTNIMGKKLRKNLRGGYPDVQTGLVQKVYRDWNVEGAVSVEVRLFSRASCQLVRCTGRNSDASLPLSRVC